MINRDRLVKTFCDLVRIDSPSSEEEQVAQDLASRLKALGLKVERDDYGNIVATEGGVDPLLLSAHMDTVEPGRGVQPRIEGDRIVSDRTTILGGDCKAGVAAILEALESLKEDGVEHRPVEVALTREEELGLVGARNLDFSMITAKEAIVFDGEGPVSQITSSSPTYISFDVDITGRAAHAGVEPEKGVSAIRIAAEFVSRLPQGRLDTETTFNVGRIEGGSVRNTVPESASVSGEFRTSNDETLKGLDTQLRETLDEVRSKFPGATIEDRVKTEFETYTLADDDPATALAKAAMESLGLEPTMLPSGGGTDGNVFRQRGISSVVVGMADHGMHTKDEYVTIPDLVDAAHFCEAVVRVRAGARG